MRRVVVTGLSMINSLGLDKDISFNAILNGETGVRRITHFDASSFPVQIAAEVQDFNPESILSPKDVKKAHRFIQLGLYAAKFALIDSDKNAKTKILDENELSNGRYLIRGEYSDRFGISSASGIGGLGNIQDSSITCFEKGARRVSPFFIPSSLVNMLGGFVSINHNLKGSNVSSVTACAASTHAMIEAAKTIMLGCMDRMLVVGAESAICEVGIAGFASMKALSARNDEPQKASRPFDKQRDGFIMGEGAGSLVLEDYESAKARGAFIYAELIGFGESGDANHITTPSPGGEGAYRAMRDALNMAKVKPEYINAHGTSTYFNDILETQAVKRVFAELYPNQEIPPISSTKGQIGHCLGAAGVLESIITIMAMMEGKLPPTINLEEPDPECDLNYIPNISIKSSISYAMSNSFGFGGTNAVVVFKKGQ